MSYEFGDIVYAPALYTNLAKSKLLAGKLGSLGKGDKVKLRAMVKKILG